MNWTLIQGDRDEWENLRNMPSTESLRHHRITPKRPELRGLGASLDWVQVRLSVSGGQYDTQNRNQTVFNPLNSLNESQRP